MPFVVTMVFADSFPVRRAVYGSNWNCTDGIFEFIKGIIDERPR